MRKRFQETRKCLLKSGNDSKKHGIVSEIAESYPKNAETFLETHKRMLEIRKHSKSVVNVCLEIRKQFKETQNCFKNRRNVYKKEIGDGF